MSRVFVVLVMLGALLAVPSAVAGSNDSCEEVPPPEGSITLAPPQRYYSYTVTLEAGLAIATVGNDDCTNGPGFVVVDDVTIPAPEEQGGRTTAELGDVEDGAHTFQVKIHGSVSVWLLIESVQVWEDEIACSETTMTVGDGTEEPMASFVRGDDDDSEGKNSDPCSTEIGYNLDSETSATAQSVDFAFEMGEFPSWYGEFTWTPEPAVLPVPDTEIDLDGDGVIDGTLSWCTGFSGTDGSTGNPLPILPAGESWCLLSQSTSLVGAGVMQVTQTIYGAADPSFTRPR